MTLRTDNTTRALIGALTSGTCTAILLYAPQRQEGASLTGTLWDVELVADNTAAPIQASHALLRETAAGRLYTLTLPELADCIAAANSANTPTGRDSTPALHLILSAQSCTLYRLRVPAKAQEKARRAAPYVLEDLLAEDPSSIHTALAPLEKDGNTFALITQLSTTLELTEAVKAAGLALEGCYAWQSCLPVLSASNKSALSLVRAGGTPAYGPVDGWLVFEAAPKADSNTPSSEYMCGYFLEDMYADTLLPALLADCTGPVSVYGNLADLPAACQAEMAERAAFAATPTFAALLSAAQPAAINLLQGPLRPAARTKAWGKLIQGVAGLAAACLVGYLALTAFEAYRMDTAANALEAANRQQAQNSFGTDRLAAVEARLRTQRVARSNDFLILSSIAYAAFQEADGTRMTALRYSADSGQLTISLSASSYDDIAFLRRTSEGFGAAFLEGASRQQGGLIVGEIILSLNPGAAQ